MLLQKSYLGVDVDAEETPCLIHVYNSKDEESWKHTASILSWLSLYDGHDNILHFLWSTKGKFHYPIPRVLVVLLLVRAPSGILLTFSRGKFMLLLNCPLDVQYNNSECWPAQFFWWVFFNFTIKLLYCLN